MTQTTDYRNNFDSEWYLSTYYEGEEMAEFTKFLLHCFHEAFCSGDIKGKRLLDAGTGPTIHSVISASPHVEEIYLSDYTPRNLDILRSWWKGERKYLKSVFEYVLTLENKSGHLFQHTVGIPMGTTCAPLPADLFLQSHEADFMQNLLKSSKKTVAKDFNFTYRQTIDDRDDSIRSKVKDIIPIDITSDQPLHVDSKNIPLKYDVVTSSLAMESASSTTEDYKKNLKNLLNLVTDGGHVVLFGAVGTWYTVGSYTFIHTKVTLDEACKLIKENNFKILEQKDVVNSGYKLPENFFELTDCADFFIVVAKKLDQTK